MKKKGFTLIELLAVIVILAIIALIAVPQVLNIISGSKEKASEISADNYTKALTSAIARENLKRSFNPKMCEYENNTTICDGEELTVEFDGKIESAKVLFENNKISYYIVNYNVESGATPDECFVSLIPGFVSDYTCDKKAVVMNKDLSLKLSKINSITYNEYKCTHSFLGLQDNYCNNYKNFINSLSISSPISLDEFVTLAEQANLIDYGEEEHPERNQELLSNYSLILLSGSDVSYVLDDSSENNIITTIGVSAFAYKNLKIASINDNIKNISPFAFILNDLTFVNLGKGVEEIGDLSFHSNSLTELIIPDSVKKIGAMAFYGTDGSKNNIKKLVLGNNVEIIDDAAFYDNDIESLTLPLTIKTIGTSSFSKNKISELNLPASLEKIGMLAFSENCLTEDKVINNSSLDLGIDYSNQNSCN